MHVCMYVCMPACQRMFLFSVCVFGALAPGRPAVQMVVPNISRDLESRDAWTPARLSRSLPICVVEAVVKKVNPAVTPLSRCLLHTGVLTARAANVESLYSQTRRSVMSTCSNCFVSFSSSTPQKPVTLERLAATKVSRVLYSSVKFCIVL